MLAIALSLGVSVAYGLANYIGPLQGRRYSTGAVLLISQAAALVAAVPILVVSREAVPSPPVIAAAAAAGIANAAFLICLYEAFREGGSLSVIVPITAVGVALPVAYGISTGDALRPQAGLGIVFAVAGCMLAAGGGTARRPRSRSRRWLGWTLAATLASGLFLILLPVAAEQGRWWALVNARVVAVVVVLAWALTRRTAERPPLKSLPALVVPGLLLLGGTVLYTLAAQQGAITIVSVLSSLAPVATAALAVVLLGERLGAAQRFGVTLTVVGILLIAA